MDIEVHTLQTGHTHSFLSFSLFSWCYADERSLPEMAHLTKFLLRGSSEIWFTVPKGNKNGRGTGQAWVMEPLGRGKGRWGGFPSGDAISSPQLGKAIIWPQERIKLWIRLFSGTQVWKPTDSKQPQNTNAFVIYDLLSYNSPQ